MDVKVEASRVMLPNLTTKPDELRRYMMRLPNYLMRPHHQLGLLTTLSRQQLGVFICGNELLQFKCKNIAPKEFPLIDPNFKLMFWRSTDTKSKLRPRLQSVKLDLNKTDATEGQQFLMFVVKPNVKGWFFVAVDQKPMMRKVYRTWKASQAD